MEAVFRRYSDEYLHGREPSTPCNASGITGAAGQPERPTPINVYSDCEALNELDDLLSL
ncbi:hypothetical protein [Oculatella sp. LEGE 06141]|uniref:hypothetical protein n=1 Tax=Oculatella sp. LEGE 06141 TaxID=1828648 RepID=UPI001882F8EA|nr:hypothetical protein [Oculatella sp. LEGE 06141]